ncbi:MAG TPA: GH116 family glycosyl hydrolase [Opitutaceae bacterium]|nr:GH116 family glycosyl hydrolase [Opitutaceae bacterium]
MKDTHANGDAMPRREFLKFSAAAGLLAGLAPGSVHASSSGDEPAMTPSRKFNGSYEGAQINRLAFPLGGIGAGMICLEGTGAFSHISIRNQPDVFNEPCMFAAVCVRGEKPVARVLEGPVPGWKLFGMRAAATGLGEKSFGLPRFARAKFTTRFPFGSIVLDDASVPLEVGITGWSPFTPGDSDGSSLPVAGVEYRFTNPTAATVEAVFSFNAKQFFTGRDGKLPNAVKALDGGYVIWSAGSGEKPWEEASFAVSVSDPESKVNHAWFRGSWFDPLTMAWNDIAAGACFDRPPTDEAAPSPGGTVFVPFTLAPGATRTIAVRLCWYCGKSNIREFGMGEPDHKKDKTGVAYSPWYSGRFADVAAIAAHWRDNYGSLREASARFSKAFYDTTLPAEVVEAVAANLGILKSPTVLRQTDGRLWAWEGCRDEEGCCSGSCTHVWNYAQAIAHLFPDLERSLRETEFGPNQDDVGHQQFRAALPIRAVENTFHSAADGQLGGIMKVHREWRIGGDTDWLRGLWPRVRKSLDYCIETWDPDRKGWLEEPHHNTYDIEFWGPNGMCTSFYLGALQAAVLMGNALGDDVKEYAALLDRGTKRAESELFDGEYFIQKIEWKGLRAADPTVTGFGSKYSPEALALLEKEGPKYQYGTGCLSDGVLGSWIALMCGVGQVLDAQKVASHLSAVHRHNLKHDLSAHVNPQRPTFAAGAEGGLLLCTWPKGGALSLPFVYSNEVWTGIEYQVASHLICMGMVDEGLEVVRVCRARYDGRIRNPFDEYECGHWYARALASYGLLQALSGARYDAVEKVLHLTPAIAGDFRSFLATKTGYGVVGLKDGKPFLEVRSGSINVEKIDCVPAGSAAAS